MKFFKTIKNIFSKDAKNSNSSYESSFQESFMFFYFFSHFREDIALVSMAKQSWRRGRGDGSHRDDRATPRYNPRVDNPLPSQRNSLFATLLVVSRSADRWVGCMLYGTAIVEAAKGGPFPGSEAPQQRDAAWPSSSSDLGKSYLANGTTILIFKLERSTFRPSGHESNRRFRVILPRS